LKEEEFGYMNTVEEQLHDILQNDIPSIPRRYFIVGEILNLMSRWDKHRGVD